MMPSCDSPQSTSLFVGLQQINLYNDTNKHFCRLGRHITGTHDMTDKAPDTYGARLAQALEHAKMSQAELARRTGVKQQNIAYLIKRGRGSSYTGSFADQLGIPAAWLDGNLQHLSIGDAAAQHALKNPSVNQQTTQADAAQTSGSGFVVKPAQKTGILTPHISIRGHLRMSKTATLSALIDDTDPQTHAIIANLAGDHVVGYLIKGDGGAPVLNNGQAIVCDPDSAPAPGEMLLILRPDGDLIGNYLFGDDDSVTLQTIHGTERHTVELNAETVLMPVVMVVMPSRIKKR